MKQFFSIYRTSSGQLDMDIKVGDIQKIYGLKSRQAAYDRVNALKTKGLEVSWDSLNKLNAHLKEGNKLADFALVELAPLAAEYSSLPALSLESAQSSLSVEEIVRLMEALASFTKSPEPLIELKVLEKAVGARWLLTTKQVAKLIGTKPRGATFIRGSFTFTRVGKIGREAAWRVSRVIEGN